MKQEDGFQIPAGSSKSNLLAVICILVFLTKSSISALANDIPPLVIVSFGGFHWDYLTKTSTPNFIKFIKSGVYADKGIKNVFPTSTLTNHWSMVTGLYSESHGIVDNYFYDPEIKENFVPLYKDKSVKNDKRFYDTGAEPIWVTNKLQKPLSTSASFMWWGAENEVKGINPTFHMPYDNKGVNEYGKIDTLIQQLTAEVPLNLALLYFEEPDVTGHKYGPESSQVTDKIKETDKLLGYLIEKLNEADLQDKVNIIVTSDHGLAPVSKTKLIHLDDILDPSLYHIVHYNPVAAIAPKSGKENVVYKKLLAASKKDHFEVYKKADIPERLHYKNNNRVAPIVAIADIQYSFIKNMTDDKFLSKGNSGYDNKYTDMHPIFMAQGPCFKQGVTMDPAFSLVDIYPLMCRLLQIHPAPNNGSMTAVEGLLVAHSRSSTYRVSLYLWLGCSVGMVALAVCLWLWRRRRYLRYRLKLLTPEVFSRKGQVTIAWPVNHPKVTLTQATGPQMPLVTAYTDESDDEF